MALAYFAISGLALFQSESSSFRSALDEVIQETERQAFIDWIYRQQEPGGGFRGSPSTLIPNEKVR
jgi:hypothetical protein